MLERTLNQPIEEAYQAIKAAFTQKGSKVTWEKTPNEICFKQGSLWGISPKNARKDITLKIAPSNDGLHVTCASKLSADWKNISILGCVAAALLIAFCIWIATDLTAVIASSHPSAWSWLVMVQGIVYFKTAEVFISFSWAVAIFLFVVIVLEIVVLRYAHSKIDAFARQVLDGLKS